MKILVTGGGGFLGSAISRQLLARGDQVVALQRRAAGELAQLGAETIRGDICDLPLLLASAKGCDAIIHTAGKAGVWGKYADYHRINVLGTEQVLQTCRKLAIPNLVHTSSPSITHCGKDIEGEDESGPIATKFLSPYPATKAAAEQLVLAANSGQLRTTALRPHLIWGPGDPHILPHLAASVRKGKLALPGADKVIDTVFVENAARAHVLALDELRGRGRCAGRPYYISNDQPMRQDEIIPLLLDAIGIQAEIRPISPGLARAAGAVCETIWKLLHIQSEPPVTRFTADQLSTSHWYNISAAKRDLGYQAEISIAVGMERLRKWHFQSSDERR
ncbi:MAG TPA: NAD-dependent epimerase/dehydratase family protein [Xanthomonadales bacterium]|nr:NAD-dependent epimerase/dehydratase family protein [Xanthomonadales bacterium]